MGRRDEIMQWVIDNKIVENICKNIGVKQTYLDDFMQEIYLILLEYDENKLYEIYEKKQLKFFISRIMLNQWNSKTSPFYTKYRKWYEYEDGNIKITEDEDEIDGED